MATIADTLDSLNARLNTIETDLKSLSVMNVTLPCNICPCWVSTIEYNENMTIKSIKMADFYRSGERDCMCRKQRDQFRKDNQENQEHGSFFYSC